ncbi:MAG: shikimate dehydrogenase [Acidimicrobiales bacterium]
MIGLEGAVPVGRTLAAGLIGDPVAHSLSPVIHNAAYAALGLDWCYKAFLVHDGDVGRALSSAAARGLRGLSVTTPHKVAAATACDERSAAVARIGAANTVVFSGGRTRAETTDGPGLLDDLAATWRFNPAGQVCAVVGAGATARAIVAALADAGAAEVLVIDRTEAHAEAAAALAGPAGRVARPRDVAGAALVVQATSVGFAGDPTGFDGGWEAVTHHLGAEQFAVDVVYAPPVTEFLALAGAQGARVRNGLGMLVHQAAHQVVLFTGRTPPVGVMFAALGITPGP